MPRTSHINERVFWSASDPTLPPAIASVPVKQKAERHPRARPLPPRPVAVSASTNFNLEPGSDGGATEAGASQVNVDREQVGDLRVLQVRNAARI
jgi:hypothetical protein